MLTTHQLAQRLLDEVASALCLIATRNRVLSEGAGATATACALNGHAGNAKKIVAIVSGGNIDFKKLCEILSAA